MRTNIKYTYDYVKSEFLKEGITILDTEYINAHYKMKCICEKGHEFKLSWTNFQIGTRCKTCFDLLKRKPHIIKNGIHYKICSDCNRLLNINKFSNNKNKWDGKSTICSECSNNRSNKIYLRDVTRRRIKQSEYRQNNLEKVRLSDRLYGKANRAKRRVHQRKRRALKIQVNEHYTVSDELFTRTLFNNKCFNCGSTKNLTIDHHYPLSKGYALTIDNAVVLCRTCNSSKSTHNPDLFYDYEQFKLLNEIFDIVKTESVVND